MSNVGFDERIEVRLRGYEKDAIKEIVKDYKDIFDNESHFVRAAVLSFVRNWKKEYDKESKTFIFD